MTVGAGIAVQDGSLVALGAKILREVRGNVHVTPAAGGGFANGAFLGVRSAPAGSRTVFPVGKLRCVFPHSAALLCLRCFFSLKFPDKGNLFVCDDSPKISVDLVLRMMLFSPNFVF